MEHLLQKILGKLDNLEAGQQELKSDVNGLKAGQQQLQDDVAGLKVGQQEMRYDITALKTDVTGIKANITNMQGDITNIQTDITDIKKDTARTPFVEQAVAEVGKEVQELQQTSKEHRTMLTVLSDRSINHEAKLKDIV